MATDIRNKIQSRGYASPSYARGGIARAKVSPAQKRALGQLVDAWEQEILGTPVVGALPAARDNDEDGALEGELITLPVRRHGDVSLQLTAPITVQLTVHGIALLDAARDRVQIPADLLATGGLWRTQLWEFMAAFGPHLTAGMPAVCEGTTLIVHPMP